MEAESITSLTPLLEEADQWGELLLLLPLLVALEAVLSADNAIALAAISRRLHEPQLQRQALNLGLGLALVFRLGLILLARWVLNFWPLQLAAAAYLLWLSSTNLLRPGDESSGDEPEPPSEGASATAEQAPHPGAATSSHAGATGLGAVVLTLAVTDLAFSLDSVAAAVAVSDRLWLVMTGGVIGVIALRLTAELFIRWLGLYPNLERAGYLAVGLVGLRLLLRLGLPQLVPPEWALLLLVAGLFLWGFSRRVSAEAGEVNP
ncbi:DUF475 domain-containing protein [Synechococcus sp. BA-124 BA4]|uniref:TerC family protein n=1 Tax=unclassified Synechococcus TaxID=2626047 RepID=UPI0018CE5695|nr:MULTISPECIES: DUF475 domain-containing protein [unclassified Synechococcus]MEA5400474.1 DUF475 domain-containing protein [Synechococcus sp. BA-124 BA4]QPN57135.1 DUF475 domain-containing protein [Synechococcus sp. CBW1107]CAK6694155.1 hypothetical protein BBFGKLBO_01587 [Synechococcus sp. CBW1107]